MLAKLFRKQVLRTTPLRFFSETPPTAIINKEKTPSSSMPTNYQYIDNQLTPVNQLVLRTRQSMEDYVMKIIKEYFRTTQRNSLTMESELHRHGLDSLDLVEVAMQLESDLGYLIPSENLPAFQKPIHFVNYIEQVENFKVVYGKNPLP